MQNLNKLLDLVAEKEFCIHRNQA